MFQTKIALIGFGIVGGGVMEILRRQTEFFRRSLDLDIEVAAIAEKDPQKIALLKEQGYRVEEDADVLFGDPEIGIIVELVGGVTFAKDLVLKALRAGKHVVTANKHLLAKYGHEIFPEAASHKVDVYFEASVGGGMPIIKSLREGLVANEIKKVQCIINGTTNYILTQIRSHGSPFDEVLPQAQEKGFAEADPAFDVDGIDAAHKVAIMSCLAYGCWVPLDDIPVEGIRHITPEDVANAEALGYTIKLLGILQEKGDLIDARVHPAMLPKSHLLANVDGVFNGAAIQGDSVGDILLTGKGAGRWPTASAVVSDIVDVCRNVAAGRPGRVPMGFISPENRRRLVPIQDIESRYYLRFNVLDVPGVLGRLTQCLGDHQVSIASVLQKERAPKDCVPVVILTHHAREQALRKAVSEIDGFEVVKQATQVIRIEEEKE